MPQNAQKKPLFSLISVTLNNLSGLQRTHKSITNQGFSDYEWVVIDGASTDGTQKWLENTQADWISEPDDGLYEAMNKGLERARGRYLLFLNAGDILAGPDTLADIARRIGQTNQPDFIYGDSYEELPSGRHVYKPARAAHKIARGMITHHQAMLYRKDALGDLRYNTRYRLAADYDFTMRFLLKTGEALYCDFPFCVFEPGGLSQTGAKTARIEEAIIRRELGLGGPLTGALTTSRQTLAHGLKTLSPELYAKMRKAG